MAIITALIFLINVAAWISFNIICWNLTGATIGVMGVIGFVGFLIAWGLSASVALSPRDYFTQSEWNIFVIKFKWANATGVFLMGAMAILCYVFDWFEMREFIA